ncbi:MAG: N-terminal phage integrase SAM-like domain-containing protein [Trueperaceae bacterium]
MPKRKRSKKAANGQGTISKRLTERPDGTVRETWEAKISLGFDSEGKRLRKTVYGTSQTEVTAKLNEIKTQLSTGTYNTTTITVKEYFERWLSDMERKTKPRTFAYYEYIVDKYIKPNLGTVKLAKLSPLQILGCFRQPHGHRKP